MNTFKGKKIIKYFSSIRRVVVSGLGAVTPLGNNVNETWENLKLKKVGIKTLDDKDFYDQLPKYCRIAGPIQKTFDSKRYKTLGTDNLITQISLASAEEAIEDSKILDYINLNPYRVGIVTGTSAPSLNCITYNCLKAYEKKDFNQLDRMGMLKLMTNLINFNIGKKFNIKGPTSALSMSCASGLNSIGEAAKMIRNSEVLFK